MMGKLARLQPALVNRSAPLLLHDNARPHTAQQTVSTIWITFWREKNSIPERQYKMPLKSSLPPRPAEFFKKGTNKLPLRWQKWIDSMGNYFD
ncbi:unnamed protein product [Euphydryas editha]|uniref:Transposase n=1 Tax=Euphydryas editha TaxID=104508 RepID=A0AAU9UXA9_EUPED|nr:unnamed protein product [Euphydryas editha]